MNFPNKQYPATVDGVEPRSYVEVMSDNTPADDCAPLPATLAPRLSLELIERIHPRTHWQSLVDDPAAVPKVADEVLRDRLADFVAANPLPPGLPLFGYGSLLWHPEPGTSFSSLASLNGWQRRFCLWQWAYRGTRDDPGLMLAIVPGEQCVGALFEFDDPVTAETIWPVWRRELVGNGYLPAIVEVATGKGTVEALTFIANPQSPRFVPAITRSEAVRRIAAGVGPRGASADYLCRTWQAFRDLGVFDSELEGLTAGVAVELDARLEGRR